MGIIDASTTLLKEQWEKEHRPSVTESVEDSTAEIQQQQGTQLRNHHAMDQGYDPISGFAQSGHDFDPNMDFHSILGQSVQITPSDSTSPNDNYEAEMEFYGIDGDHQAFDFLQAPGNWMDNALNGAGGSGMH